MYSDWSFKAASRGVVAMFSGPSGTGKTLTAEVVAGELGLDGDPGDRKLLEPRSDSYS